MKILVVGGGRIAYFLSRSFLSKGYRVVVINPDPAECRWLARHVKATIVRGDASDPRTLDEAGADDADAVLAITASDADNLVTCQIAEKQFGVPTTVAVVSDPENETVFPRLGVRNVVSITRILSNLIAERTGVEEITNVMSVAGGGASITELVLGPDSPALARPLAEVALPPDSLIACVVRQDDAIVPSGATQLAAGDRVLLVTLPSSHGRAVKSLTGEI